MNKTRNFFLIFGYILLFLITSTIWAEAFSRPLHPSPEDGPLPIGILHKIGLRTSYALLISTICFILSTVLTAKRMNSFIMFMSISGMFLSTSGVVGVLLFGAF
ncbi:hypothetical protein [Oceanobacillus sojae]|uniref:hypothetical protein n=1 Tax=Oceanobacillus sojae TaxID=582851 RepID=UPI0009888AE6|nr:hypothetical protein [Oceanobacillus sojae]MCT1902909.1 hypothetical protein [Oceanobacillus sojae]